jgi:predicted MFS family arabinose efflux permease
LGVVFLEWGLFIPVAYLASFALDDGLSTRFTYTLLALVNAGGVFGRWAPGYFADRVGGFNVLILTVLGCFVTLLCFRIPVPTATSGERPLHFSSRWCSASLTGGILVLRLFAWASYVSFILTGGAIRWSICLLA